MLGFPSKFDLFWRHGNGFWIYFKHKERMPDFPGIKFAYPSRVTSDSHCVAS
jgi:hypothetical protein